MESSKTEKVGSGWRGGEQHVILRGPLYRDESDRGYAGREQSSGNGKCPHLAPRFLSLKAENTVFVDRLPSGISDDDDDEEDEDEDDEDDDVDARYLPREIGQIGLDGHRQSFTRPSPSYPTNADLQASPTSYRVP